MAVETVIRNPRCSRHEYAAELPVLCHTCQRIKVEHDIVTRAVDVLRAAGYDVRESEDGAFTDSREDTLAILFDLDEAYLIASVDDATKSGWVRFVFGNDGFDVISDYTTNLEDVLKPVHAFASTFDY